MGSTAAYALWVEEQLSSTHTAQVTGPVSTRAMFGEYCVYLAGRVIAIICEDTVFVKQVPTITEVMDKAKAAAARPFEGAKLHWILDVEDHELVEEILLELYAAANEPKKRSTHRPGTDFPWAVGGPAAKALAAEGITSLAQLAGFSDKEIRALHGVGPKAMQVLRDALVAQGLSFREA